MKRLVILAVLFMVLGVFAHSAVAQEDSENQQQPADQTGSMAETQEIRTQMFASCAAGLKSCSDLRAKFLADAVLAKFVGLITPTDFLTALRDYELAGLAFSAKKRQNQQNPQKQLPQQACSGISCLTVVRPRISVNMGSSTQAMPQNEDTRNNCRRIWRSDGTVVQVCQ